MRRVVTTGPALGDLPDPALALEDGGSVAVADKEPPRERLRTEFEFELPRGYVDPAGNVHTRGTMRLATARDELLPLYDDRVRENSAYLTVVLLSRVIIRLGSLSDDDIDSRVMEALFASDLAFLQDLYRRINTEGHTKAAVTCPSCHERFMVDMSGTGGGGQ
jgi:hypothetical protein